MDMLPVKYFYSYKSSFCVSLWFWRSKAFIALRWIWSPTVSGYITGFRQWRLSIYIQHSWLLMVLACDVIFQTVLLSYVILNTSGWCVVHLPVE